MTSVEKKEPKLVACHQCDLLVELPEVLEGSRADCPRCSHTLIVNPEGGYHRLISLALAALGLLFMANTFTFMSFKGGGVEQIMTLFGCARELYVNDNIILASVFFAMVVILPLLYIVAALSILVPLSMDKKSEYFRSLAKFTFAIGHWAMADVFLFGALVSLTKIASLATVGFGLSFYSFVFFVLFFARLVSSMNKEWLWREWENLENE